MDFTIDATTQDWIDRTRAFLDEEIHPAEADFERETAELGWHWTASPTLRRLQAEARSRGLWNLFLPG